MTRTPSPNDPQPTPESGELSQDELDAVSGGLQRSYLSKTSFSASTAKSQLDSLSELSETTCVKLQTFQDASSKQTEALSNILKKVSDTQDGIINNLK